MKKTVGLIIVLLAITCVCAVLAQTSRDLADAYESIPDNEYYVTVFHTGGTTQQRTVPSCAEALALKDSLLHSDSSIAYITVRAKYYVHLWHDDCNGKRFTR